MWISKKKWNETKERIKLNEILFTAKHDCLNKIENRLIKVEKDLEKANKTIYQLSIAHKEVIETEKYTDYNYMGIGVIPVEKERTVFKYIHSSDTNTVPNVTLEELARYVIDNEPIVREETINIKKEYR